MTIEDALASLLEVRLAPLCGAIERLAAEVDELHRAIPPMLLSVHDAATRLGVSLSTARRRVRDGTWPARRDGRRVLVDLGALRPIPQGEIAEIARSVRTGAQP